MSDFCGRWELVSYALINDELPLIDHEPRVTDIQSWLVGASDWDQSPNRASGLRLEIDGDRFSETVTSFSELMFDVEGIQVNDYHPMMGRVHAIGKVEFLLPDGVPDYATPPIENDLAARYSDGDTLVCDTLRRIDDSLLRQVSVITDELYIDRVVLIYRLETDA